MKIFRSEFLNVDLDIKSKADLAVLTEAWTNRIMRMHAARLGRRHWLRLALVPSPKSPAEAIRRFAKLVERLPRRARQVWAQAAEKEFDIGVQAGWERHSGEWVLDADVMRTVAKLGASLRFTVYSPLSMVEANKQKSLRTRVRTR